MSTSVTAYPLAHARGLELLQQLLVHSPGQIIKHADIETAARHLVEAENRGAAGSNETLNELFRMVGALCQQLGDDPEKIPCDIWRLKKHVDWLCEIKSARSATLGDLVTVLKRNP